MFNQTTEGIVLFSRYVYFLNLLGLAYLTYKCIYPRIGKFMAILVSEILLTFNLYGLYYLWYDIIILKR